MHVLLTAKESKLLSRHPNKTLNLEKSLLALLSWSEVSPPALGHVSKCQDATDWIEAEDFPFLWFFCLFWVYTIIKKSLVLAGNGKTKQNKETTLPWLIAAVLWPDLVKLLIYPPTLGVGIKSWELHSKKRLKGPRMQLPKSPLDIRLSNNNNYYNNINNKLKYLVVSLFLVMSHRKQEKCVCGSHLKWTFGCPFYQVLAMSRTPMFRGEGSAVTPLGKCQGQKLCVSSSWKYGADRGEESWQSLKAR